MRIKNRLGFTLMEIMVVIIVIAVLASVAGPMITGITDQGRVSATKSSLSNLKSAIVSFNGDVGHYPHAGKNIKNGIAYGGNIQQAGLHENPELNCLLTDKITTGKFTNLGLRAKIYNRKWKGPYMDGDPADFLYDAWGTPIAYGVCGKKIFLRSAGPDLMFAPYKDGSGGGIFDDNYEEEGGDDIVVVIARSRRKFDVNAQSTLFGPMTSPAGDSSDDVATTAP